MESGGIQTREESVCPAASHSYGEADLRGNVLIKNSRDFWIGEKSCNWFVYNISYDIIKLFL